MKNLLLLMFFSCTILVQKKADAQVYREWTGSGNNWNTASNWNPNGIAYAQLEFKGNGLTTSNNDAGNPFSTWRLYFSGTKAYTLTGNPVSLFDYSGNESWILSDATANQLINLNINFSDGGARYSWITNRSTGALTFGGNIAVTGASITALRIAGTDAALPAITFNGTISGSRPVDIGKDNGGADQVNTRVFFNGNNASYSGITTLYAGTLSVSANSALGSGLLILGNGTVTNTLAVTGTTSRSQNIQVSDGSTAGVIDVASGQTFTLSGLLTQGGGTNNITKFGKAGSGTLSVSGASTAYVGQVQIGNGTVIVQNNNGLGNNTTTSNRGIDLGLNVGDVSQANNVVLQATNGITVPQSIYVASNASGATRTISLNGSGSATFNNEIYLDGDLTLSGGSGTINMSGNITPNSTSKGIIVTGGTVVISGSNTYTGNTVVNAGTLTLGAANRIANTSNVVLGGGTFSTGSGTGNAETVGTLNLSASTASTIALGTGSHTLTFANSSGLTPWGSSATLNITGWTGTGGPSGAGSAGKIIITGSGLTQAQLDKISFNGVLGATFNTSTGELVPKGIATASVNNSPQTYTGSPIAATFTTNSGGAVSDIKYNGSNTTPTNAGSYTMTVDVAATNNYAAGNDVAAGTFTINKVTPTLSVGNSPVTYNGSAQNAVVNGSVAGTVSNIKYNGSGTVPTTPATYAVTADFAPGDATNYNSLTNASAGNFVINPVSPANANFRSTNNGNINTANIWEYDGGGGTWIATNQVPGQTNNVEIRNNITFTGGFTIGAGKILSVSAGTADFGGNPITVKSTSSGTGAIGRVTGTLTGATNVTVERYIPGTRQAWRLLAAPTTGTQTIRQAWMEGGTNNAGQGTIISSGYAALVGGATQIPGGFDAQSQTTSIKYYDSTSGSFKYFDNVNHPVYADSVRVFGNYGPYHGGGYFLFVRGDRNKGVGSSGSNFTTLRSTGGIKTGAVTKSVASGQFKLVANPYPSAIYFGAITRGGNVSNGFYLWDAGLNTTGGYVYFSSTGGNYEAVGASATYPLYNSIIQSGQGFFVTSPGGTGTITINESAKPLADSSRNSGLRPSVNSMSQLNVVLTSGKLICDGNKVVFGKYSNNIDADDALKMYNPGENLSISSNGKALVVESRETANAATEVQYEIKNLKQQDYTLEFKANNMGTGEAYLVDNYLGTQTALSLTGSTKVNFSVTADAKSSASNRFKVVFRPAVAVVEGKPMIRVSPNPVETGVMNVTFSQQAKGRYSLKLADLSGRLLLNTVREHAGGTANQQVALPSGLASGTYQLVITAPDRTKQVQKVYINTNK